MQNIKELFINHKSKHNCDSKCQYPVALSEIEKEFKERIAFLSEELNVHKQICMCAGCVAKRRKIEILNEVLGENEKEVVRY